MRYQLTQIDGFELNNNDNLEGSEFKSRPW